MGGGEGGPRALRDGRPAQAAIDAVVSLRGAAPAVERVVGLSRRPDHARTDLIRAIEAEPALALALLAHSGVRSVPAAVDAVPPATLAAIAQSIASEDVLSLAQPWRAHLRLHALAARLAAERIGAATSDDVDELVAAALLHDVGKAALRALHPESTCGEFDGRTPEARAESERRRYGADHAELGAAVLRALGVAPALCERVAGHHHAEQGSAASVRLADALVHFGSGHPVDLDAVVAVAAGCGIDRPSLSEMLYEMPLPSAAPARALEPNPLSPREREVMRALADGMSVKEIALSLGVSPSTVRNHLHRIYTRIGTSDRAQAVLLANALGWI